MVILPREASSQSHDLGFSHTPCRGPTTFMADQGDLQNPQESLGLQAARSVSSRQGTEGPCRWTGSQTFTHPQDASSGRAPERQGRVTCSHKSTPEPSLDHIKALKSTSDARQIKPPPALFAGRITDFEQNAFNLYLGQGHVCLTETYCSSCGN